MDNSSHQKRATDCAQIVVSASNPPSNEQSEITSQPTSSVESTAYDNYNLVELTLANAAMVLNIADLDFLEFDDRIKVSSPHYKNKMPTVIL